jgi:hypothetical protein
MGRDRFCLGGAVIGDGGGRDRRFGYLCRFGLEAGRRFREFVCAGVEASVSSISVVAGEATVSSSSLVSVVSSEVAVSCTRKLGSSAVSTVVSSNSAGAKVGARVGPESWRWSASSFDMSSVIAAVVAAASLLD